MRKDTRQISPASVRATTWLKSSGLSAFLLLFGKWKHGEEKRRTFVVKTDRPAVLFKCWIHDLPSCGVAAPAVLNLSKFYTSDQLHSSNTNFGQAFDILALQITAKLLVHQEIHALEADRES